MNISWCFWSFFFFMRDFATCHVAWGVMSQLPVFPPTLQAPSRNHYSDGFSAINCFHGKSQSQIHVMTGNQPVIVSWCWTQLCSSWQSWMLSSLVRGWVPQSSKVNVLCTPYLYLHFPCTLYKHFILCEVCRSWRKRKPVQVIGKGSWEMRLWASQ
jgi:hypothetical protein